MSPRNSSLWLEPRVRLLNPMERSVNALKQNILKFNLLIMTRLMPTETTSHQTETLDKKISKGRTQDFVQGDFFSFQGGG